MDALTTLQSVSNLVSSRALPLTNNGAEYQDGWQHGLRGGNEFDNPYAPGTDDYQRWRDGWEDAL